MEIIDRIKQIFRDGSTLSRLILVNVLVFLILQIISIVLTLFNVQADFFVSNFAVSASLKTLIIKPWTLFSYMFYHQQFFHILFNMIALYWFGKLFLMYNNEKQLLALYVLGGLSGSLLYVFAYNTFPFFESAVQNSILLGASGAVMAIIVAAATQMPNMELRLMLIGNVKLKYLAAFYILISLFGVTSNNAGGEIAHLGGALMGYLFVVSLRQGKDFTKGFNFIVDGLVDLFKPKKLKVKPNNSRQQPKMSDADYNRNKAQKMKDIDRILDKIKSSGYESLTAEEKKSLFDQAK